MIESAIDGMAAPPTTRLSRRKVSRSQLDAASCGFGALDFAEIVPAEIVAEIMSHMRGIDLAASAAVTSTWTILARATAEVLLRRRIPTLPRHSTCLNWVRAFKTSHPFTAVERPNPHPHLNQVRAFASLDAFERAVGPKPPHCWWNEWPELRMAETKLAGAPCGSAEVFSPGGGGSCSRALLKYSRGIGWMVATGWPTLHAAACLLLGAGGTEAGL